MISEGLGLGPDGQVGGVTYNDVVTRTADGWRIAERVAIGRRPDRMTKVS
jgi:hypothetical protein